MNPRRDKRHRHAKRLDGWRAPITVRMAVEDDADEIARVAGRDSRPVPDGPLLVAERDGEIEVALSLHSGAVVADPFRRTAELVELVRCHAAGLRDAAVVPPAARGRPGPAGAGLGLAGARGSA